MDKLTQYNIGYSLKNLDTVIQCLDPKDACFSAKVFTLFHRMWNLLFGDHTWYNSARARKIIKYYTWHAKKQEIDPVTTKKVKQIFERLLCHMKRDGRTYAHGLKREWIGADKQTSHSFRRLKTLPIPTDHLLFHVHAGEFGRNCKLEGGQLGDHLHYLIAFLKAHQKEGDTHYHIDNRTMTQLEKAALLTLRNLRSLGAKQIKEAFATNTPLLIPGGWIGAPSGHAVYYEIVPDENHLDLASFHFYQVGNGVANHAYARMGNKLKANPQCTWKGIQREKFTDPQFLLMLYEMQVDFHPPSLSENTIYGARDLYGGLRSYLEPTDVEQTFTEKESMSVQYVGICVMKSLFSFLRTRLGDKDYKRLKGDLRLQTLVDRVKWGIKTPKISDWRLIEKSLHRTARSVQRLYDKKIVSTAYLTRAETFLEGVSYWLERHQGIKHNLSTIPNERTSTSASPVIEKDPVELYKIYEGRVDIAALQPCTYDLYDKMLSAHPSRLLELAEEGIRTQQYVAVQRGMIDWVKHKELNHRTEELSEEQKEELIVIYGQLAKLFFFNCSAMGDENLSFPERDYFFLKIQKWQSQLSPETFRVSKEFVDNNLTFRNQYYRIFDPKIQREISAIQRRDFQSLKRDQFILNENYNSFAYAFPYSLGALSIKYCSELAEKPFFQEAQKRLSRWNYCFSRLSQDEQFAKVYCSSYLPKWFCALRDTNLYSLILWKGPRFKYPYRNCQLKFKVIDGRGDGSKIVIFSERSNPPSYGPSVDHSKIHPGLRDYRDYSNEGFKDYVKKRTLFEACGYDTEKNLQRGSTSVFSGGGHFFSQRKKRFDRKCIDLFHMRLMPSLSIAETLEYFTKYPDKLSDPTYQLLLKLNFFELGLLSEELENGHFRKKLVDFLKTSYKQIRERNEVQPAVFILHLSRQIAPFCEDEPYFKTAIDDLRKLLKIEGMTDEERSLICGEILAYHANRSIETHDVAEILHAKIIFEKAPIRSTWRDPHIVKASKEVMVRHAKKIREVLLAEKGNLLNAIDPGGFRRWEWDIIETAGSFPECTTKNGQVHYYPLMGKWMEPGMEVDLPHEIVENPLFLKIFPNVKKGVVHKGFFYSFEDEKGQLTLVQKIKYDSDLRLEQKQNGEWVRFICSDDLMTYSEPSLDADVIDHLVLMARGIKKPRLRSRLMSHFLAINYYHWQSLTSPSTIYIESIKKRERVYCVNLGWNFTLTHTHPTITRLSDQAVLTKPPSWATRYEEPEYIHCWRGASGNLVEIHFSRSNLRFRLDENDHNRWLCDEMPQFFLDQNILPFLGTMRRYLLLCNREGKQKVLIPFGTIKKVIEGKDILEPIDVGNTHILEKQTIYNETLVYHVHADQSISSTSRIANLFLALQLTAHQEYEKAAALLRTHGNKLSPYTSDELYILISLYQLHQLTGDEEGNSFAISYYAGYLLAKNKIICEMKAPTFSFNQSLFHEYYSHYQNGRALRLKPYEESFMLKFSVQQGFKGCYWRLRELGLEIPEGETVQESKQDKVWAEGVGSLKIDNLRYGINIFDRVVDSFFRAVVMRDVRELARASSVTRKVSYFTREFAKMYRLAKQKDPSLRTGAQFALSVGNEQTQNFGALFLTIMAHPKSFPDQYERYKSIDDLGNWEQIIDKAVEILKGEEFPKTIKTFKLHEFHLGDKTPADFQLEPAPAVSSYSLAPFKISEEQTWDSLCDDRKIFDVFPPINPSEKTQGYADWLQKANQKKQTSMISQELNRLTNDLTEYQSQQVQAAYRVKSEESLQTLLQEGKQEALQKINECKKTILFLVNRAPDDVWKRSHQNMQILGKMRRSISMPEVLIHFGRGNFIKLAEKNGNLTQKNLEELQSMVAEFLLLSTFEQQRSRAEEALKIPENEGRANRLAELLLEKRCYNPKKFPSYLVFEYYANILIRPVQVEKLALFLVKGDANPIVEMIMGSGKSKVLLPLLAWLRADGECISLLVVPESLFESVGSDTQSILRDALGQGIHALHFDRNTPLTEYHLQTILDELLFIQKERECLIMTSKSIQCLILKCIELSAKKLAEVPNELQLQLLHKILCLLRDHAIPLIDEADTVLNVLQEVSYSIGTAGAPKEKEIETIATLYEILYTDVTISATMNFESNPRQKVEGSGVFTDKLYRDHVMERLSQAYLAKTCPQLNEQQTRLATDYLCRRNEEAAQPFFDGLEDDTDLQNQLALASEVICCYFPFTLSLNCGEHYGLDQEIGGLTAIPFSAVNKPNRGSTFANLYITMGTTFQTYVKEGIPRKTIVDELERLQSKVLKEQQEMGLNSLFSDTEAWKRYEELKGEVIIPLFHFNEEQVDRLMEDINSDPIRICLVVKRLILPQIVLYQSKLTATPHDFTEFFKKVIGFTGTLWNPLSMHRKLSIDHQKGIDAKTVSILWENRDESVFLLESENRKGMFVELMKYDLIADAGGYFKGASNRENAEQMQELTTEPIAFYNARDEQVILEGERESPLIHSEVLPEKRKTFLDQSHTIGADVLQKRMAKGVVTISRHMLLRDLLQSAWRLRGLDQGQRAYFAISKEIDTVVRLTVGIKEERALQFEDILLFCIYNQAGQKGENNQHALDTETAALLKGLFFKQFFCEEPDLRKCSALFEVLKEEWFTPSYTEPRKVFGTIALPRTRDKVVKNKLKRALGRVDEIASNGELLGVIDQDQCISDTKAIYERLEHQLSDYILATDENYSQAVQVEVRVAKKTREKTELQIKEENIKKVRIQEEKLGSLVKRDEPFQSITDLHPTRWYDFYSSRTSYLGLDPKNFNSNRDNRLLYYPIKHYFALFPNYQPYQDLFKGIQITENVLQWNSALPDKEVLLFGKYRTPLHFLRLEEDGSLLILSQTDAHKQKKHPNFLNLTLGYWNKTKPPSQELQKKLVKVKFLNGESYYSKAEQTLLKEWFLQSDPKTLKTLFIEHILPGCPLRTTRYNNSILQSLFKELLPKQISS